MSIYNSSAATESQAARSKNVYKALSGRIIVERSQVAPLSSDKILLLAGFQLSLDQSHGRDKGGTFIYLFKRQMRKI